MAGKRVKGGTKIITGQIAVNTVDTRIHLFDGKYTTGYRLVGFNVADKSPLGTNSFMATLYTEKGAVPAGTKDEWDWTDVRQIGWGMWQGQHATLTTPWINIREESLVIEDLYIANYGSTDNTFLNYEIILEKYDIAMWDAAAAMVRNNAQSGPA